MNSTTCQSCGVQYRAGAPFCPTCGEPPGTPRAASRVETPNQVEVVPGPPTTAAEAPAASAPRPRLVEPLLPLAPLPPEVAEVAEPTPPTAAPAPTPAAWTAPAAVSPPSTVEIALEAAAPRAPRQLPPARTLLIAGGVVVALAATAIGIVTRGSGGGGSRSAAVATTAGGFRVTFGAPGEATTAATTAAPAATTAPTTAVTTEAATTATAATTVPTTAATAAPPPTAPATTAPPETAAPGGVIELRTIGSSVDGTPIVALRRGTPGGRVAVAVGVIHGDRAAGLAVTAALREIDVPAGIDLWVIDTINPDGVARGTRTNSRGVDLNRNFASADWQAVGAQGDTWAGTGPASEPETRALQSFLASVQPSLLVWWDQFTSPLVDDGEDVTRPDLVRYYASITGLPVIRATCKGTPCVGNATTFVNRNLGGTAFTVSLPRDPDGFAHADAFLRVAVA